MGLLIFVIIIIFGSFPSALLLKQTKVSNPLPYYFLYGSLISIPLLYGISAVITKSLFWGLVVWLALLTPTAIVCFFRYARKTSLKNVLLFLAITVFFFFLSHKTFQYHGHTFFIASNLYADMGVHIPVIRSFSHAGNFPFELPFFGGKHLTYHFFYDFFTGVLEYTGVRIDISYNLIFSLIFASLLFVCIDVGKVVFQKKWVGIIAFALFILPSDLSFIPVLQEATQHSLISLWHHNMYQINSFLGERTLGGFLYINTYLNQRHLFFALTAGLALFVPFWSMLTQKPQKYRAWSMALIGLLIGLIPLWNVPIFLIMTYLFIALSLIFNVKFKTIGIGVCMLFLLAVPQMLLITSSSSNGIRFEPGYLVHDNLSLFNFTLLWIFNLGAAIITILGGFFVSGKNQKKLFIILLPLFIIPNVFQITRHMFDNHKFFNFWFLYMCFFSASFLMYLMRKGKLLKILACFIFLILVLSGLFNFLVVKNDVLASIPDYAYNPSIKKMTFLIPNSQTVVTNGEIFDPLSIAGRKTFLGRINDIYSFGGNPQERIYMQNDLFLRPDKKTVETLSQKEKIQYIIIYKDPRVKNLKPVRADNLNTRFKIIYEDSFLTLYKI